ncbi:hypothetical protein ACHHRT_06240 [Desulfurivibrio sp. D14AmB]|uniref:hypothetical protein n=1 Tax=Desulfurivibrio sp. D14AmB TaxID=3374370 RepID=UPI00376EA8FB
MSYQPQTAQQISPSSPPARAGNRFNLTRYFSLISFVLVLLAGIVLGGYFHHLARDAVIREAESSNISLTKIVRNALWIDIAAALTSAPGRDPAELRAANAQADLLTKVVNLTRDSDVLKIKVYDGRGIAVFSSETG